MKLFLPLPCAARVAAAALATGLGLGAAEASTYGTLNNFDTVNTTGEECHGFEIELEDCHSTDISSTYNWNHYGVPRIIEDDSVPEHVKCLVRWESGKNPDGSWAAYTAIPAGPIAATNGHMFTNPNVNFGGEHFGVGYRGAPTVVRYFWLVDNGAGQLVRGPSVEVATPTFNYAAGQVLAVIEPPEPPEVRRDEFGKPTWVKSIKTTTHNNNEVRLRDLRSDDPDDDDDVNWRNGEPDEVETEWHLLQEEFDENGVGIGGDLEADPQDLEDGDEVVTHRWEFYEYTGPLDPENGEALADNVGPDDLHGVGVRELDGQEINLAEEIVVGQYLGAQMSAFDVDPEVSLIEHLQDGEVDVAYPERTVVIGGLGPFTASRSGDLPAGMSFDEITGILSGTPTESGDFSITVEASDAETPVVSKEYNLKVAAAGAVVAPHSQVNTTASPAEAGTTSGGGSFDNGTTATVRATPAAGFKFLHWTEQGRVVSTSASYEITVEVNHDLVAHFGPLGPELSFVAVPEGGFVIAWPLDPPGWILQESATLVPDSWQDSTRPVVDLEGMHRVMVQPTPEPSWFFRLSLP